MTDLDDAHEVHPLLEGGPYDFEGTCIGCGGNSTALNRWTLCRFCTTNPDAQTYPPEPE
ncbi:hypothetical protein [Deinococcus arcticus]|uniref:hypothetical protein n=1 Tax=Deinococcus arcticus TaxID=2136176 RepID=UPI001304DFA6|nr:hypothetical protein [Deinococcus arcticus]